jgi:rubrerythrin
MATAQTARRDWIVTEFSKGIESEHLLQTRAENTALNPPDPSLAVLYHEIAEDDKRHRMIVETIATRYGYNPAKAGSGGLGGTLERLKERMGEIGAAAHTRLAHDLASKADSIHWTTAWVHTFQSLGDTESARELAAVLAEEKSHHEALQEGLNRMIAREAIDGN